MRASLDDTRPLTDRELLDKNAGRRFLDFYGDEGMRFALEKYGLRRTAHARRGWFGSGTHAFDERHADRRRSCRRAEGTSSARCERTA
jgi:hypothetical protein